MIGYCSTHKYLINWLMTAIKFVFIRVQGRDFFICFVKIRKRLKEGFLCAYMGTSLKRPKTWRLSCGLNTCSRKQETTVRLKHIFQLAQLVRASGNELAVNTDIR